MTESKMVQSDIPLPASSEKFNGPFGWQPIETAPRDGSYILIAFGPDWVAAAAYVRDDDDAWPWKFLDQHTNGAPFFNGARDDKYGPTHWMPLPSPPGAELNFSNEPERDPVSLNQSLHHTQSKEG